MSMLKSAEQLLKSHGLLKLASDGGLAEVTGHRSYVLLGDAALLEKSLLTWTMRQLMHHHGFTPVMVPNLIRDDIVSSCGFDPHGERTQVYTIRGSTSSSSKTSLPSDRVKSTCLSGTSEIPLVSLHLGKTFDIDASHAGDKKSDSLPKKYAAMSRCYRAETGNKEKPLFRVHCFNKVEMVALVQDAEQSADMLGQFVHIQEQLFSQLGIRIRRLAIPEEDLGPVAHQKVDIEAFFPFRADYGEISSASDCRDHQGSRLNVRVRRLATEAELAERTDLEERNDPFVTGFVHTVNGTAAATPRLLVPIIEEHQDKDGRVRIPDVLRQFMPGREFMQALKL